MSAGAKLTAKLVYQLMEDFNLFDQTVRLHAFIRASNDRRLSVQKVTLPIRRSSARLAITQVPSFDI